MQMMQCANAATAAGSQNRLDDDVDDCDTAETTYSEWAVANLDI